MISLSAKLPKRLRDYDKSLLTIGLRPQVAAGVHRIFESASERVPNRSGLPESHTRKRRITDHRTGAGSLFGRRSPRQIHAEATPFVGLSVEPNPSLRFQIV